MASLMELVDRVNRGELIDRGLLEVYHDSPNSAEKFLAHHAMAMLDLRRAHHHMLQSLEAIDFADQKVVGQFVSIGSFLGLDAQKAAPILRFAASAIGRRDYALGLEALHAGVAADRAAGGIILADRERSRQLAGLYAQAASGIGFNVPESLQWGNAQPRIAWVVSHVSDDEPTARTLRGLCRHMDSQRFRVAVYSTEFTARRDRGPFGAVSAGPAGSRRGRETIELLQRGRIPVWTAGSETPLLSAIRELSLQLLRDRVDAVVFDHLPGDPIASVVAEWELARVRIGICRGPSLQPSSPACLVYTDPTAFERDRDPLAGKPVETRFILEGIDLDEPLPAAPQRAAYGIPESAVVLATSAPDLDAALTEPFVETVTQILRAHPHAIYLLVGEGELAWQKRKFDTAGVGKRIGYAGKRRDLPGFLRVADAYLAEFPSCDPAGILQAMAMDRAVVAMRWGDAVEHSQAAALVGADAAVGSRDCAAYVERASRIIRDAAYRSRLGRLLRQRCEQHFAYPQTCRHLEQLIEQLMEPSGGIGAAAAEPPPALPAPLAEVA